MRVPIEYQGLLPGHLSSEFLYGFYSEAERAHPEQYIWPQAYAGTPGLGNVIYNLIPVQAEGSTC